MLRKHKVNEDPEVKRLLGVANKHLMKMDNTNIDKNNHNNLIDDAIVASLFSAAAVEAGLNIFIRLPIMFVEDEYNQNLLGDIFNVFTGIIINKKIDIWFNHCKALRGNNILKKNIENMFSYRNKVIHVTPKYIEAYGVLDDYSEESPVLNKNRIDFNCTGLLQNQTTNDDAVGLSEIHYKSACEFIEGLIYYDF